MKYYIFLSCVPFLFNFSKSRLNERTNVVVFLIDDYGYADISFEGNTQVQTPNIDRIASEGVRMKRFYQSSAACAPTRASLLTGRYHLRTGVWGVHWGRDYILPDEITLGDVFRQAGYRTGSFGKWHSGKSAGYHSWDRGFDVGLESSLYNYFDTKILFDNKLINIAGPVTDVVGDQAVRFIEQHKDQPFLCYVPFQSIHEPFNCPPEIFEKYKSQGYSDHVARMYGMIETLDNNIGKILNALDRLQLTEKTIVWFMVDDGPSPGFDLSYANRRMNKEEIAERERGWARKLRGGKASIWEGGSISPCYIRWPGRLEAGREIHTVTGVIDVAPTLADMCGIDLSNHPLPLDGRSFYPLLRDPAAEWPERYYFDNTNFYQIPMERINMERPEIREISALKGPYKYVRIDHKLYTGTDSLSHLLYNLDEDPGETTDLAARMPAVTEAFRSAAEAWYEDILRSGRAFRTPVFQLGYGSERAVFINGDAFSSKSPDLERKGFPIVNWTRPGATLRYAVNVRTSGRYRVELAYSCQAEGLGSQIMVGTEYDSAVIIVNHERVALSRDLQLPAGRQTLQVRLHALSPDGQSMESFRHLIVHRLPATIEEYTTSSAGFTIRTFAHPAADTIRVANATVDFWTEPAMSGKLIPGGDTLFIRPFCAHEEQLEQLILWLDFAPVQKLTPPLGEIILPVSPNGRRTLNVEFLMRNGSRTAARIDYH